MFLSLVVCTRDRAEKLQQTLASILALDIGRNADYELLVIDNGSKDRTREVCAAVGTFFSGRLRIVGESRPGLARARNAGLANAKGEVIAFIDDDIVPDSQWLEVLMKSFVPIPSFRAYAVELSFSIPRTYQQPPVLARKECKFRRSTTCSPTLLGVTWPSAPSCFNVRAFLMRILVPEVATVPVRISIFGTVAWLLEPSWFTFPIFLCTTITAAGFP